MGDDPYEDVGRRLPVKALYNIYEDRERVSANP